MEMPVDTPSLIIFGLSLLVALMIFVGHEIECRKVKK